MAREGRNLTIRVDEEDEARAAELAALWRTERGTNVSIADVFRDCVERVHGQVIGSPKKGARNRESAR